MDRSENALAHEHGLALFLAPGFRRTRFRESLDSERRRKKLLDGLYHFYDFDSRFSTLVPGGNKNSDFLLPALRKLGAGESCYLMSTDRELDMLDMSLAEALVEVADAFAGDATFISCIPGKLAYFQGEDHDNSRILHRPN
jgi:hypothetical protein